MGTTQTGGVRKAENMTDKTCELIRTFLDLPPHALPRVNWVNEVDQELGSPWYYLKDALRQTERQRFNHVDLPIRLCADRDEWQAGIEVVV